MGTFVAGWLAHSAVSLLKLSDGNFSWQFQRRCCLLCKCESIHLWLDGWLGWQRRETVIVYCSQFVCHSFVRATPLYLTCSAGQITLCVRNAKKCDVLPRNSCHVEFIALLVEDFAFAAGWKFISA
jgi:hypothetical protein